jgi:hypothetical protein
MLHALLTHDVKTIQGLHDKPTRNQSNIGTLPKLKTVDMNTLSTPRLHHQTNASTLLYTLRPGITTWYLIGSKSKTLKVTMKKPSGNPKTRTDHQDVPMKPHLRHREVLHLDNICLEDSTSGCSNRDGLIENELEVKKTFWNMLAM